VSNIKKVLQLYNILIEHQLIDLVEEESKDAEEDKGEVVEEDKE
jgi:hypothetical protein